MAVLNIRVEDRIRDQLKEMADTEGVTVSEYVRDLVMAAIVPVYQQPVQHGDELAPETMRIADRQVLSLLHRVLARVLPEGANDVDGDTEYQLRRARAIEAGFAGEYWQEVAGFRTELSKRDCGRVLDILDMFRVITYSIKRLEEQGTTVSEELSYQLEFRGFDHNDGLEHHMASYVKHLMSDGRWAELKPQLERNDDGNSHHRILDTYTRMLAEHRRIKDSRGRGFHPDDYLLSMNELEQIAAARVHPSHRG
ncbi:YfbU family protein [Mycolicibacterium goodii]|uniref:YfbU family protein n=1 Tax=Mycolicibacterium goodii TaxID=134601 RepID=A0ABS6HXS8_MYCGD|nr:YfbU family protein [Mycolicibacterium goodii]MBU8827473.1 YfbU family protein [Mycolicibacterium goodii]MBU8841608.1 YfbU family protein [Mycolicibacterium goodii]